MKIERTNIINIAISIGAIFLSAFLSYNFSKLHELETRKYLANRDALSILLKKTYVYSNYYKIDWEKLDKQRYSAYLCAWDDKLSQIISGNRNERFNGQYCIAFERLQNAKMDFEELTLESRLIGSDDIAEAIKQIDNGFDEVFYVYVSNEYYSRAFIDAYNEVMKIKFDNLEQVLKKELKNSTR